MKHSIYRLVDLAYQFWQMVSILTYHTLMQGLRLELTPNFFRSSSEIPDQWEVLFDDISLCKIIGEGAFGKVYSGELLRQTDVANIRKISTLWRGKEAKEEKAGLGVAVKMLRSKIYLFSKCALILTCFQTYAEYLID